MKNLKGDTGMKRIQALIVVALLILGARVARADTLTPGDNGRTVIDVVTTPTYGTTTITWLADANFAASLRPDSPYWVPGINRDGSMPLTVAVAFIAQLNKYAYLGITNWRLPTTIYNDSTCTLNSAGGTFAYNCGEASPTNPGYPYSELGGLFYNGLGGQAHNNITLVHNSAFSLFKHFQPYLYWSETKQFNNPSFGNDFWFQNGFQGTEDQYDSMFVLPVSTTTTGTPPTTVPACAATIPPCPDVLPGLGLNTTIPPAKPTLQPSFDGTLIYDPTLNVTFLANANLAGTLPTASPYYVSGINPDGSMNAKTLADFLDALNNPAHPFMGLTGWTVPRIAADGLNPNCTLQRGHGNPDIGYNCDGLASQLGELFYDQLGGVAGQKFGRFFGQDFNCTSESRPGNSDHGEDCDGRASWWSELFNDWDGGADVHDIARRSNWEAMFFNHLVSDYYWQCQPAPADLPGHCQPGTGGGEPSFSFLSGYQGSQSDPNNLFVMLVVPGDAIPHAKRWW
jgi:hypothetical protein